MRQEMRSTGEETRNMLAMILAKMDNNQSRLEGGATDAMVEIVEEGEFTKVRGYGKRGLEVKEPQPKAKAKANN